MRRKLVVVAVVVAVLGIGFAAAAAPPDSRVTEIRLVFLGEVSADSGQWLDIAFTWGACTEDQVDQFIEVADVVLLVDGREVDVTYEPSSFTISSPDPEVCDGNDVVPAVRLSHLSHPLAPGSHSAAITVTFTDDHFDGVLTHPKGTEFSVGTEILVAAR